MLQIHPVPGGNLVSHRDLSVPPESCWSECPACRLPPFPTTGRVDQSSLLPMGYVNETGLENTIVVDTSQIVYL